VIIRKRTPQRPPAEPAEELLDLPLGTAEPADDAPPSGDGPPEPPARSRRRSEWLWLLLLVVALPLGAAAGYLLRPGPPVAVASAELVEVGTVRVGASGEAPAVVVSNRGESPLAVSELRLTGSEAADFRVLADGCTGSLVAPGAGCEVRVGFVPGAAGRRRGRLELHSDAANSPLRLPLLGSGVAPELAFEPGWLELGELTVGSAGAPARVWLSNRGSAPLTVRSVELRGLAAADFVTVEDGCGGQELAAGERCSLRFRFVPTAAGERRAELEVVTGEGRRPGPRLVGRGLAHRPVLRLDPELLDFGRVRVGERSRRREVRLRNAGNGPLRIDSLTVGVAEVVPSATPVPAGGSAGAPGDPWGDVAADTARGPEDCGFEIARDRCSGKTLPPGGSCAVEILFSPREEGRARTFFEVRHGGEEGLHQLPAVGVGTAPGLRVEPPRLSFQEVPVGSVSEPGSVRLESAGSGPLALRRVTIEGADAGAFELRAGECDPARLEPGEGCAVMVRFRPRRDGPHRAELVVRHDADGGTERVTVNGLGTSPRLHVAPDRLDFGTLRVGGERDLRLVLSNSGRAPMELRRVRLAGRYTGAFALLADRCSGIALGPGEACSVQLRFTPGRPGTWVARLEIDHTADGGRRDAVTVRGSAR